MLKDYTLSEINKFFEYQYNDESNVIYVAIFGMNINVYNLLSVGRYDPLINEMIKNHYIFTYTGDYNICWFAIGVFVEHYKTASERIKDNVLESKAKKEWQLFECKDGVTGDGRAGEADLNLSSKSARFLKLLKEYKGFDMTRVEEYLIHKNYNINVYSYSKNPALSVTTESNKVGGHYSFEERYQHPNPDKDTIDVNIAVVNIKDRSHIFYIKDIEKAIGLTVCPKYHHAVFKIE
jgi:hypothetical protein